MKTNFPKILITLAAILAFAKIHAQDSKGYAPVNGLQLYYEVYGQGDPVVLLHGSYMTIGLNWSEVIPELSKTRKVIAVEMQGHGHTADINRPYSYESMASDVAGVLNYLKIGKADIIGYSLGGTVALQFGIRHPELTDKVVVISSVYKYTGWSQAVRDALKSFSPEFFDATPLKTEYDKVAPDPSKWKAFVVKLMKFDEQDFDLGAANIKAMKAPVLLINGDNDGIDLNHTAEMYRLLGGSVFADMGEMPKSRLAVIPGKSHVTLMMDTAAVLGAIVPFLDEK